MDSETSRATLDFQLTAEHDAPCSMGRSGMRGGPFAILPRYLGLAIDLDEPSMFEDFVAWLSHVLRSGDVPAGVLDASLEIVTELASESGLVRAARICTSARLRLTG